VVFDHGKLTLVSEINGSWGITLAEAKMARSIGSKEPGNSAKSKSGQAAIKSREL